MGRITAHTGPGDASAGAPWHEEVAQLLEEHHLVAWSPSPKERDAFGLSLARYLTTLEESQVCQFHGSQISDLYSFCNQLERTISNDRIKRVIEGKSGIVDALRSSLDTEVPIKRRYFVWHDAHVMLRYDHRAFGRLVDALTGVAAESEYVSEDLLVIQRSIFIGAPSLDVYGEDPRGQFRNWYSEDGEEPLWRCVTGLHRPPVLRYRIEDLADEPAAIVAPPLRRTPGGRRRA